MNRILQALAVGLLVVLSVLPIGRTLLTSVQTTPGAETVSTGERTTEFTLDHYREAFLDAPVVTPTVAPTVAPPPAAVTAAPTSSRVSTNFKLLGNSLTIAFLAALFALALGLPYAYLIARTNLPARGFFRSIYLVPLVLPPLLTGMAWSFIPAFEPGKLTGNEGNVSWGGVLAIVRAAGLFALCYFPIVVLFARRALQQVPATLEESARMVAGPWATFRRVTLPLIAPGTLAGALFVFLFALNDFSLVDYLNWVRPTADRISVYPYQSFVAWTTESGQGVATALGTPLALIGAGLLVVIHRLIGRRSRSSIGTAFRAPRPLELGAWRPVAVAGLSVLLIVSVGIPAYGLLSKAGGVEAYRSIVKTVAGSGSSTQEMLWTLWHAGLASCIAVPLAFVLAHRVARKGSLGLSVLALLPLALPPIFLGIGYLRLTSGLEFSIPGVVEQRNPFVDADSPRLASSFLLVAKYMAFAVAALWASFLEIDPKLEEAGSVAGIKPLDRMLGILVPLARPALALSFVLVFVFALREIDTLVLLTSDTLMHKIYTAVHFARDSQVAALSVILIAMQAIPFALLALFSDGGSRFGSPTPSRKPARA